MYSYKRKYRKLLSNHIWRDTYVIIYTFIEYLSYLLSFYTNPSYQTPHLIWGNIILRHIQLCNESSRACNVILFPTRCGIISELLKDEKNDVVLVWILSIHIKLSKISPFIRLMNFFCKIHIQLLLQNTYFWSWKVIVLLVGWSTWPE